MPGLTIYTSNRMEILAEQLARIIHHPLASPLTPEIIVVQSRGMERWISMALAELHGISANCVFPFPNAFLEDIFRNLMPDLPDTSPFDPAIMTIRLMKIIPDCLDQNGFDSLKAYLTDDDNQLKLFQLSGKIADLFDQYLVFRPELIFQWEQGKEDKHQPHAWQARLWRELTTGEERRHRARLRQMLFEQIKRPDPDRSKLPERVSIFGISYLPVFHLQAFAELSRVVEINIFLMDPCREYWADIVSDREIKKIRRKFPGVAENIKWYHFERGNQLLASMGTLGREFFELISGLACEIREQFEDPGERTFLARIQSDILNLRDRESPNSVDADGSLSGLDPSVETTDGCTEEPDIDTSVQVHSCHSPMREIEILHDNLLAMFEEDPDLMPKDIIVMTPDIETYAPYVQAVFAAQTEEALRIPFSIADQSLRRTSRMIDGFLALLELAGSRFGAVQVVRLLEYPGIKERFGLADADLKIIERWIKDTHIRWGIDENSRHEAGLPASAQNTWRAGLDRLILGYAMPGENRTMFHGIVPYDNIEGGEAQVVGRFLEFTDRLFAWARILAVPRSLGEWRTRLLDLLDQFLRADETAEREVQLLRHTLENMGDKEAQAGFHKPVELEVIRVYLKSLLEQSSYGSGFLTGGVTFCAMLPMRSIPFKVICLIGMNNDAFPRDHQPLNFDLMARYPKTGDRSRRNDDKYLFLESIISARKKFYISYVGQSVQDNARIPPSVLVSEFLDTIAPGFASQDQHVPAQIVTTHRLQPFSPSYFREDTGLFSYSAENMFAAAGATEKKDPPPFFAAQLPLTPQEADEWQKLDLYAVNLFFSNPAKFLIQRRLGIQLQDETYLFEEREIFDLQALERYQVEQNLVKSLLSGGSLEDFKPIQKAIGQLPHGNVGEYRYAELSLDVQTFVRQIEKFTAAVSYPPIEVDLTVAGFHLSGRLNSISDHGYVHIRYARRRVKDLLQAWIYHLVYCSTAPSHYNKNSFLICKDSALQFEPLTDSLPFLEILLVLFRQGLEEPIRFFPNSSYEYAEQLLKKATSEPSALSKARKKWVGSDFAKYAKGESTDPYYDLCFRRLDPLDDTFKDIALQVFEPMLAHSREIKL
jgi:exodeoxyribonuclease V gamma subunit